MDANLLDAVAGGSTRRVVYVADACCYGPTGCRSITEDEPSRPSAWRHGLTPALDRLDGYIAAGLPIVTAFPGWVYGNGSCRGARKRKRSFLPKASIHSGIVRRATVDWHDPPVRFAFEIRPRLNHQTSTIRQPCAACAASRWSCSSAS